MRGLRVEIGMMSMHARIGLRGIHVSSRIVTLRLAVAVIKIVNRFCPPLGRVKGIRCSRSGIRGKGSVASVGGG